MAGLDRILMKVWKYLGDIGATLLTNLFNKVLKTKKGLNKWRKSTIYGIDL